MRVQYARKTLLNLCFRKVTCEMPIIMSHPFVFVFNFMYPIKFQHLNTKIPILLQIQWAIIAFTAILDWPLSAMWLYTVYRLVFLVNIQVRLWISNARIGWSFCTMMKICKVCKHLVSHTMRYQLFVHQFV